MSSKSLKIIKLIIPSFAFLLIISCSGGGNDGGSGTATSSSSSNGCASEGACSDHGGVNCDAGPDTDGSVVCNDGWTGSTVQYHFVSDNQNLALSKH